MYAELFTFKFVYLKLILYENYPSSESPRFLAMIHWVKIASFCRILDICKLIVV